MALYTYKLGLKQKNLVFGDEEDRHGYKICENKAVGQQKNNVMLDGINLGEIMKQTVMEELRLIKAEAGESLHRMEGS